MYYKWAFSEIRPGLKKKKRKNAFCVPCQENLFVSLLMKLKKLGEKLLYNMNDKKKRKKLFFSARAVKFYLEKVYS